MTMQIAIHLDDAEHEAFERWLASTAAAIGGHLEAGEAVTAMIRVAMRFTDITDMIASQIRYERAAGQQLPPELPPGPASRGLGRPLCYHPAPCAGSALLGGAALGASAPLTGGCTAWTTR